MSTISEIQTELPTGTWQVDPVHSSVEFSVRHLLVANFRGSFGTFEVTLDENGLRGTVDVGSVDVSEENLKGHLLSPEFFDAERNPQFVFSSSAVRASGGKLDVEGELTLKGVTKPIELEGTLSGPATHPFDGSSRLGLELDTVIDRTAFGLDWNVPLASGGFYVGNDVKLHAELELVLQP